MATTSVITVLIDTYNYGRFVEEAIESVLSQDFPAEQLEVIVVDDGSTDDTAERVKRYGARVKYLQKQNGGQASAFNLGFAHAQGEFVALLDADDYFLPGKLQRVLETFESDSEIGMVYHQFPQMHPGGVMVPAVGFEPLSGFLPANKRLLSKYRAHQSSCLAFRRSTLQKILPVPESIKISADGFLELTAVLIAPVRAIGEDLAVYRIHGKNLYAGDYQATSAKEAKRLVASTNVVRHEIEQWIRRHTPRIGNVGTQRLLDGMTFLPLEQQFRFEEPRRFSYFAFLVRRNYALAPIQSFVYTAIKYLLALTTLLVGYKRYQSIHTWCGRTLNLFRTLAGEKR